MQATRDTFPFVLTAQASFTVAGGANVTASPTLLPSAGLVNPLQVPFEVTELRFMGVTSRNDDNAPLIPGLDILLRVGRRFITNGYVPLAALTPIRPTIAAFNALGSGAYPRAQFFRWILPVPFILAPAEGFTGSFVPNTLFTGYSPNASDETVTLAVTAVGRRYVGRTPKVRKIPFASGGWLQTAGAILPEHTLENTFPQDLTVTSIQAIGVSGATVTDIGGFLDSSGLAFGTNMRIEGPGGLLGRNRRTIISGAWGDAVFGGRSAIDIPHVLKPHDWYRVTIDTTGGGSPAAALAVGITGFREE